MTKKIPDGIRREHILAAIDDLNNGVDHDFAASTVYDVLFEGRRYPPKAVIGLAVGKLTGSPFRPQDFSGGIESKCSRILEVNGFSVVAKDGRGLSVSRVQEETKDDSWSREELLASVVAYMEMLDKERLGQAFVKKNYYRELATRFGRSEKAFEYRMQNISYVMTVLGRSWLTGLKPAKNVGANVAMELLSLIAEVENQTVNPSTVFEIKARATAKHMTSADPVGNTAPLARQVMITQYERDPLVKARVLEIANGICECCGNRAPFVNSDGDPFLEVHHVRQLADKGPDTVKNAVALCPNCHREAHYGQNSKLVVTRLYEKVKRLTSGR